MSVKENCERRFRSDEEKPKFQVDILYKISPWINDEKTRVYLAICNLFHGPNLSKTGQGVRRYPTFNQQNSNEIEQILNITVLVRAVCYYLSTAFY